MRGEACSEEKRICYFAGYGDAILPPKRWRAGPPEAGRRSRGKQDIEFTASSLSEAVEV